MPRAHSTTVDTSQFYRLHRRHHVRWCIFLVSSSIRRGTQRGVCDSPKATPCAVKINVPQLLRLLQLGRHFRAVANCTAPTGVRHVPASARPVVHEQSASVAAAWTSHRAVQRYPAVRRLAAFTAAPAHPRHVLRRTEPICATVPYAPGDCAPRTVQFIVRADFLVFRGLTPPI